MPRIRSRGFVISLLSLSALLPPGGALAQSKSSQVTGRADLVLGDEVVRSVVFSAEAQADGSAYGQIEFTDPNPLADQDVDGTGDSELAPSKSGVHVVAEVDCVAAAGDVAVVGGHVTKAEPARYVGKQVLLFVEDSDRAKGRFTWGFYEPTARVYCDQFPMGAYAPDPVFGGAFKVAQ
jgi:hypothetical protein